MILILVVTGLLFAACIWVMLHWSYASGERADWVQKLSDKGYMCKTWEDEMALVSLPGGNNGACTSPMCNRPAWGPNASPES
jgi:hypothetical protein